MTLTLTKKDKGFSINFTLKDNNGNVIDLTNKTVSFILARQDDLATVLDVSCLITDAPNGKCKYIFSNNDLDINSGNYLGVLQIKDTDYIFTSKRFDVIINENLDTR